MKALLKISTSIFVLALLTAPVMCFAQWTLDKGHTKFTFIASHHGISEVDGYFKKFDGKIYASKDDLSDAVFEVSVETASINTDLEPRDNHLKSEDMFDVVNFPAMSFKSTAFKKIQGNKYTVTGDLTMKGITKPITLDVVMNGPVANPNQNAKNMQVGIKATGKLNRSDFKIGGKLATVMVGDEIEIRVTGEFNKPL
jgi:polyisoprenoid-binding protein YceI